MGLVKDLRALSNPAAFEWAVWQGREGNKRIKVEVRSAWNRERGSVAGRILADAGNITVSTRYVYAYGINDAILFRGKKYVITGFDGDNYEITPQNTVLVKSELSQEITMRLFEVNAQTRNLRIPTPVITSNDGEITITVPDVLGASIYYETSDSAGRVTAPSSLSAKYTAPFTTTAPKVAAIALKKGYMPSEIAVWTDDTGTA